MKKILFSLLVVGSVFVASAQNYSFQSFLNVRALGTGTNLVGVTNLSGLVTNAGMINNTNTYWTNLAGAILRGAAITNFGPTNLVGPTFPIFKDVRLWFDREGRLPFASGPFNSSAPANTNQYAVGLISLHVALSSPLGSNGPIGINIAPIWDGTPSSVSASGTNFIGHPNTPTSTADDFSFVIPGGVGYTTITTNLPVWRWPGAYGLRVRTITNQFIMGGENAITNAPYIYRLGISGFVP